jgi:hypothetical protein
VSARDLPGTIPSAASLGVGRPSPSNPRTKDPHATWARDDPSYPPGPKIAAAATLQTRVTEEWWPWERTRIAVSEQATAVPFASDSLFLSTQTACCRGSAAPMRRAILLICLLAAGCSSSLLPMPGQLASEDVGGGLMRIAVPRSGLADCASPDDCVLVRAGEATRKVGATHFMVLPGYGGSSQRDHAYIRVFRIGSAESVPSNALSAEEALTFFRKPPPRDGRRA